MSNYNTKPHIFFIEIKDNNDEIIILPKPESLHLINSLRIKPDEIIWLIDGKGKLYEGKVSKIDKGDVSVRLTMLLKEEIDQSFGTIIVSIIKFDRLEMLIEKLTELNCKRVILTQTARSQISKEYITSKIDKLNYIAINACKQSERIFLPKIDILDIDTILNEFKNIPNKYIATTEVVGKYIKELDTNKDTIFFIGPEGGFENNELKNIISSGFEPISLSKNILRTETAGIMAYCMIKT